MKNALICLEQLGIGGVETFTITQIEEFCRRGIKCYVLCRDGILRDKIKNKKNIYWFEFDFELKNGIDYEKSLEIEKFVEDKKIDFIYVHQFSIIPYILPVIFKTQIPYVAYLHNIVPKTCEWFMDTYPIYKTLFPIFFEGASKLIAITDTVRKENMELFNLSEEKYITINNSLDFSKYPDKKIKKLNMKFDNLVLFGRISEQKRNSIYTAVKFYYHVKEKYNKDAKLTIVGDGEIYDEIVEMYKDKDIYFKGAVVDMAPEIEKADILLGVDRCMLEAVASKKPAIVCGYNKNIVLITPNNLKEAITENFTGINLGNDLDEIFKYSEKELLNILEENYRYVKEKLAITNSVYLDIAPFNSNDINLNTILYNVDLYMSRISELEQDAKKWYETSMNLYEERDILQNNVDKLQNNIDKLQNTFVNKFKRKIKQILKLNK